MLRKIVKIDEEKCNGCGLCVPSCAEGAIQVIDGKARLVNDIYCDGLGACLGECPQDAIHIEEREAPDFNEHAAIEHVKRVKDQQAPRKPDLPCGCPGTAVRHMQPRAAEKPDTPTEAVPSELSNWPVQLKLVPPTAPYLHQADLLLTADCVPFALADFHTRFLRGGKPVLIGCPKLDDPSYYVEKLASVLKAADIRSLAVIHMEVPCCSGLTRIAQAALDLAEVKIPAKDITIGIQGNVLDEEILQ